MLGQKGGFPVASQLEAEPRPSLCISPFPAWELHPWTQDTFTGQAQAALWGTHSAPPAPPEAPGGPARHPVSGSHPEHSGAQSFPGTGNLCCAPTSP